MRINFDKRLEELRLLLQDITLPTQAEIARFSGVDQPLVSNAKRGRLKRSTPRSDRLYNYLIIRKSDGKPTEAVNSTVKAYLKAGGDPSLLVKQLRLLTEVQTGQSLVR